MSKLRLLIIFFAILKTGTSQNISPSFYDSQIYVNFPGGEISLNKFWTANFNISNISEDCEISSVYVKFFIDSIGKISEINIIKGSCSEINNEILRVFSIMPNWIWDEKIKYNNRKCYKIVPIRINYQN